MADTLCSLCKEHWHAGVRPGMSGITLQFGMIGGLALYLACLESKVTLHGIDSKYEFDGMARTKKSVREKEERKHREQLIQQCIAVAVDVRKPRGVRPAPRRQFGPGCPFGSTQYVDDHSLSSGSNQCENVKRDERANIEKTLSSNCVDVDCSSGSKNQRNFNKSIPDVIDLCNESDTCSSDVEHLDFVKKTNVNDSHLNGGDIIPQEVDKSADNCRRKLLRSAISIKCDGKSESSECKDDSGEIKLNKRVTLATSNKNLKQCDASCDSVHEKLETVGCVEGEEKDLVNGNTVAKASVRDDKKDTDVACKLRNCQTPCGTHKIKVYSNIKTCIKSQSSAAAKIPVVCLTDILLQKPVSVRRSPTRNKRRSLRIMETTCVVKSASSGYQLDGSMEKGYKSPKLLCNPSTSHEISNGEITTNSISPSLKVSSEAEYILEKSKFVNSQVESQLECKQLTSPIQEHNSCQGSSNVTDSRNLDKSASEVESSKLPVERGGLHEDGTEAVLSSGSFRNQDSLKSRLSSVQSVDSLEKSPFSSTDTTKGEKLKVNESRNLFETFSLFSDDGSEKSSMCSTPPQKNKDSPTLSMLSPESQDKITTATSPSKSDPQKLQHYSSGLGKLLCNKAKTIFKDVPALSSESESDIHSQTASSASKMLNADLKKQQRSPQLSLFEKIMSTQNNNSVELIDKTFRSDENVLKQATDKRDAVGKNFLSENKGDVNECFKHKSQEVKVGERDPQAAHSKNSERALFEKFMNIDNCDKDFQSNSQLKLKTSEDQKDINRSVSQSDPFSTDKDKVSDLKSVVDSTQTKTPKNERSSLFETIFCNLNDSKENKATEELSTTNLLKTSESGCAQAVICKQEPKELKVNALGGDIAASTSCIHDINNPEATDQQDIATENSDSFKNDQLLEKAIVKHTSLLLSQSDTDQISQVTNVTEQLCVQSDEVQNSEGDQSVGSNVKASKEEMIDNKLIETVSVSHSYYSDKSLNLDEYVELKDNVFGLKAEKCSYKFSAELNSESPVQKDNTVCTSGQECRMSNGKEKFLCQSVSKVLCEQASMINKSQDEDLLRNISNISGQEKNDTYNFEGNLETNNENKPGDEKLKVFYDGQVTQVSESIEKTLSSCDSLPLDHSKIVNITNHLSKDEGNASDVSQKFIQQPSGDSSVPLTDSDLQEIGSGSHGEKKMDGFEKARSYSILKGSISKDGREHDHQTTDEVCLVSLTDICHLDEGNRVRDEHETTDDETLVCPSEKKESQGSGVEVDHSEVVDGLSDLKSISISVAKNNCELSSTGDNTKVIRSLDDKCENSVSVFNSPLHVADVNTLESQTVEADDKHDNDIRTLYSRTRTNNTIQNSDKEVANELKIKLLSEETLSSHQHDEENNIKEGDIEVSQNEMNEFICGTDGTADDKQILSENTPKKSAGTDQMEKNHKTLAGPLDSDSRTTDCSRAPDGNISISLDVEKEESLSPDDHHSSEIMKRASPSQKACTNSDLNTSSDNFENDYYDDFVTVNFCDTDDDSDSDAESVIISDYVSSSCESADEKDSLSLDEKSWNFCVNRDKSQPLFDLIGRVSNRIGLENLPTLETNNSTSASPTKMLNVSDTSDMEDSHETEHLEALNTTVTPVKELCEIGDTDTKNIMSTTPLSSSKDKGSLKLVIKGGRVCSPANSSCFSPHNSNQKPEYMQRKTSQDSEQKDPVTVKLIRVPVPEGKGIINSLKAKYDSNSDRTSYDYYYPISKNQPSTTAALSSTSGGDQHSGRWKPKIPSEYLSSAHRSVRKLGYPKPIEVLMNPVNKMEDPSSAFCSTNLDQYLAETQNLVLCLGKLNKKVQRKFTNHPISKVDSQAMDNSIKSEKIGRKLGPEPNVQIPEKYSPDFDEIENIAFMSFPNEESINAHVKVEKTAKWGSSTAESLLDLCRVGDLYEAEWKGDMKRKVRRAQMHHMTPCSQETWRGIHKKMRKYKKLYCFELDKMHGYGAIEQRFCPEKTSDITKIKGWKNKLIDKGELENAALCSLQESGRLHWKMEDKLVKNLSQTDLKELGLEYLKRRRRKPVTYTHKKEGRRKSPECELRAGTESSNITCVKHASSSENNSVHSDSNMDSSIDQSNANYESINHIDPESRRIILKLGGNLSFTDSCQEAEKKVLNSSHNTLTRRSVFHALSALNTSFEKKITNSTDMCGGIRKSSSAAIHQSKVVPCSEGSRSKLLMQKKFCEKPGCRYGCICHLCEIPKNVSRKRKSSKKGRQCQEEYCRLGCICDDSAASVSSTSSRNRSCDREHCQLGCVCESIHGDNEQMINEAHCGKVECMLSCKCPKGKNKAQLNNSSENLPTLTIEPDFMNKSLPTETDVSKQTVDTDGNKRKRRTKSMDVSERRNTGSIQTSKYAALPKRESTYRLAKNLDAVNRKAKLIYESSEIYQEKKCKRRKETDVLLETLHDVDPSIPVKKNKADQDVLSINEEELEQNPDDIYSCARTTIHFTSRSRMKVVKADLPENNLAPPKLKEPQVSTVQPPDVIDLCDSPAKLAEDTAAQVSASPKKTSPSIPTGSKSIQEQRPEETEGKLPCNSKRSDWKMQLVCLKPAKTSSPEKGQVSSRLLTFTSNCDWSYAKAVILNKVASCITRDSYPDPQTMFIGKFKVEILPKPHKPTKKPNNVPREFQDALPNDIYAIKIRITEAEQDIIIDLVGEEKTVSENGVPITEANRPLMHSSTTNAGVAKSIATVAPIVKPCKGSNLLPGTTAQSGTFPNIAPKPVINVCTSSLGISGFRGLSISNTSKQIKFPSYFTNPSSGSQDVKRTAMVRPSLSLPPQQQIGPDEQQAVPQPVLITRNASHQSPAGSVDLSAISLHPQLIQPTSNPVTWPTSTPTTQLATFIPVQSSCNAPIKLLKLHPSELQRLFPQNSTGCIPQAVKLVPISLPSNLIPQNKGKSQEVFTFPVTLSASTPVCSVEASEYLNSSSTCTTNVTFTMSHPVPSPLVYTSVNNMSSPSFASNNSQISKPVASESEMFCGDKQADSSKCSEVEKQESLISVVDGECSMPDKQLVTSDQTVIENEQTPLPSSEEQSNSCTQSTSLDEDIEKILQFVDDVKDSENPDHHKDAKNTETAAKKRKSTDSFTTGISDKKKPKPDTFEHMDTTHEMLSHEKSSIDDIKEQDEKSADLPATKEASDSEIIELSDDEEHRTIDVVSASDKVTILQAQDLSLPEETSCSDVPPKVTILETEQDSSLSENTSFSKWHTQMVCFKTNVDIGRSKKDRDSTESASGHRILEITSNCNWLVNKMTIFNKLSNYLRPGEYPRPMILWIGKFKVQILKKADTPANIPAKIKTLFKMGKMYSVRVKITSSNNGLSEQKSENVLHQGIEVVDVESEDDETIDVEKNFQSQKIIFDLKRQSRKSRSGSDEPCQRTFEKTGSQKRKSSSSNCTSLEENADYTFAEENIFKLIPHLKTPPPASANSTRDLSDHTEREKKRRREIRGMFDALGNLFVPDRGPGGKLWCLKKAEKEIRWLETSGISLVKQLQTEKVYFFKLKKKMEKLTEILTAQGCTENELNRYLLGETGSVMVKTFSLGASNTRRHSNESDIPEPSVAMRQASVQRDNKTGKQVALPHRSSIINEQKSGRSNEVVIEIVRDDDQNSDRVSDSSYQALQETVVNIPNPRNLTSPQTIVLSHSPRMDDAACDTEKTETIQQTLIQARSPSKSSTLVKASPTSVPETNDKASEESMFTALNYQQQVMMSDDEVVTISLSEDWLNDEIP